jgi:AraC-like DNA-binding protein
VFRSYRPGPPLNEFVDCFWLADNAQTPRKEQILPGATIELVVNLCDDEVRIYDAEHLAQYRRLSGIVLSGTYSRAFACDATQHASMLGVHFKPGGAYPFLGAKASELADSHADLQDFWGRPAVELREQLFSAKTPLQRFRVMEKALTERLQYSVKRHPAIPAALHLFGPTGTGAAVREAAREVGISKRYFIQLFREEVGLTPKLFCRLLRFQRARALAQQLASVLDWAQLANECGYFDQSHLINDFEQFSGLSPARFLQQLQPDAQLKENHLPIRI